VQHKTPRIDLTIAADLSNKLGRKFRRLSVRDLPADDAPAPDIHDKI
jgi:hypothetical protein